MIQSWNNKINYKWVYVTYGTANPIDQCCKRTTFDMVWDALCWCKPIFPPTGTIAVLCRLGFLYLDARISPRGELQQPCFLLWETTIRDYRYFSMDTWLLPQPILWDQSTQWDIVDAQKLGKKRPPTPICMATFSALYHSYLVEKLLGYQRSAIPLAKQDSISFIYPPVMLKAENNGSIASNPLALLVDVVNALSILSSKSLASTAASSNFSQQAYPGMFMWYM